MNEYVMYPRCSEDEAHRVHRDRATSTRRVFALPIMMTTLVLRPSRQNLPS